jgi:threonylcarbamoyladenosine tRNA methylthiotransferase MtaB
VEKMVQTGNRALRLKPKALFCPAMQGLNAATESKKVAFHTLGCRLNFAETGALARGFSERGYQIVDFGEQADVVMVNTCTVTDQADSTCRNLIRKARNSSPEGKVVVVGCYAQMDAEKVAAVTGVDLILGTSEKYKIFDYLDEEDTGQIHVDQTNEFWGAYSGGVDGHTRAFLKIQDGCNYICSFCIIPRARGRSRAMPWQDVVEQARKIVDGGAKEIVLTGVNIGEYEEASGTPLWELVARLLEIEKLQRLRLSSVEPNTITQKLLETLKASPKAMDHFHVPLQSGSDAMLARMRRKYDTAHYRAVAAMIKDYFPRAGLGADIILGHPGETDIEFEETMQFLRDVPITHFHPFPFSKRKGTLSAKMEGQLGNNVKKSRVRAISMFGEAKLEAFAGEQIGTVNQVLFEQKNERGLWEGHSSNFVKVLVESSADLNNTIVPVRIISQQGKLLYGEIQH